MGKKPAKKNKGGNKQPSSNNAVKNENHLRPFVSICTPTFNRRPFWPMAIECFNNYDYPKDRIEWIIVDDGSDSIEDLVKDIPQVKYFREEKQMVLGRKRNYMHSKAIGDIIVYQDDDDYYPPERISHAVEMLMSDPNVLASGSSILFLYFKHIQQMYRFGPYGPNHSTAGTFAFKRELLKQTKYDDFKALAEERDFLKDYTVPFIQLDPLKTILVFSHEHNTFDKRKLLEHAPNPTCQPDMNIVIDDIVKDPSAKKFFLEDIDDALAKYEAGEVKNKPEVLHQIDQITKNREKQMQELERVRQETMQREDVKKAFSEADIKVDNMKRDLYRILETNKRLVAKMKTMNKNFLSAEDKKLMAQVDKDSARPPTVGIQGPTLKVIQSDKYATMDPQSVNNAMQFVGNHEVRFNIQINEGQTQEIKFQCGLEFEPHPSQTKHYLQNQVSEINLDQALSGQNVNEEDVNTIMEQTECNKPTAINALKHENGDVISCIMNIDKYKCDEVAGQSPVSEEDLATVMEQTECNRATATKALASENGDVIACIMNIDNYKCEDAPSTNVSSTDNEDVRTIMEQTSCDQPTAEKALAAEGGDVVSCIMNIDNYKCDSSEDKKEEENIEMVISE